jgi:urease subunit alpha
LHSGSLTFMSQAAIAGGVHERLGLHKRVAAVKRCRTVQKRHMLHNAYAPAMEIDRRPTRCAPTAFC